MSEIQKHIESCRSEDPLAQTMEACGNESALQAALQPLLRETMQGYEPVATTAPTSPIAELPGVLISIIRRVATKPLAILGERPAKQSLLGTLLDTWNAIRSRLAGNPSQGIPDRRADMTAHSLPTALALLNDRCVYNPGVPDGISMAQLIGNTFSETFPLVDNTRGWAMRALWPMNIFPWLGGQLVLGADSIVIPTNTANTWLTGTYPQGVTIYAKTITGGYYSEKLMNIVTPLLDMPEFETTRQCNIGGTIGAINMPKFRRVLDYWAYQDFIDAAGVETIHLPAMDYLNSCYYYDTAMIRCADVKHIIIENWDGSYANSNGCDVLAKNCPELLDIDLSGCKKHKWHTAVNCPKLEYVKFGTMTEFVKGAKGGGNTNVEWDGCVNLLKIEFGQDSACSIDLGTWSPTLDSSNLQQFLTNFRDYIALRLTDNGSGKTLTLSQAVYDTIKDESNLFVFDEGTMTIYAYLTNIKHWTVTK